MPAPYIRKMVPLYEDANGYRADPLRPCAGRALLEANGSQGKVMFSAQNLKAGIPYTLYLVTVEETESVGLPLGLIAVSPVGKAEARFLFDAGADGGRICAEAVVALVTKNGAAMNAPLVGAVDRFAAPKRMWRDRFREYVFPKPPCAEHGSDSLDGESVPAPEPLPEIAPEALPAILPKLVPDALPEVMPETLPEPEFEPEPAPEALPMPMPETLPGIAPEVLPEPELEPEPAPEALPMPVLEALPENFAKSVSETESELEPEPIQEAKPEHAPGDALGSHPILSDEVIPQPQPDDPHRRFAKAVATFHANDYAFIPAPHMEQPAQTAPFAARNQQGMAAKQNDVEDNGRDAPENQPLVVEAGENILEAQPEMEENAPLDVWRVFETHTPVYPFAKQNADVQWVQIRLDELARLPFGDTRLTGSPFVTEGYEKGGHLLLGMLSQGVITRFILGVPGLYEPEERRAAARLGFRQFKTTGGTAPVEGAEGYWLLVI